LTHAVILGSFKDEFKMNGKNFLTTATPGETLIEGNDESKVDDMRLHKLLSRELL
jgi:hypothetical protein